MRLVVPWDHAVEVPLFGHRITISWSILLLILGVSLVLLLATETLILLLVEPMLVPPILRGVLAEIMTGRESGIAVFLEGGVPVILTIQYSAMQDLATSFIVYPVFVYLLHRYHDRDNLVMRTLRRTETQAKKHKKRVQRQGPIYLFLFMLIPFMVNGPLIGLMIGRLVKIRMGVLVTIVVAATILPAIAWTLFYNTLFRITEQIIPSAPTYITIGVITFVVLLVVTGSIVEAVKENREKKKEGDPERHRRREEAPGP